ncbi:MAG: 1,4-alpha-glucan branching protein GlgB [Myxococcota bacterium]
MAERKSAGRATRKKTRTSDGPLGGALETTSGPSGEPKSPSGPPWSLLTDDDLFLFNEGSHFRLYEKLGAHPHTFGKEKGTFFAVWAPDATRVEVVGDFNYWSGDGGELTQRGSSGIFEGFLPGVGHGAIYKYRIHSRYHGYVVEKADPFAFKAELPPNTASVVWDARHDWKDSDWMKKRASTGKLDAPMSVYEMHLGSWKRVPEEGDRFLTYGEMAPEIIEHVKRLGFTHVEFMPIMEHPFYGSWGYQITGYFAPTSRYGDPEDLMALIDQLHQSGIGVILDWVPSHFPNDEHALGYFDGTHLFEHADRRLGFHPDWSSWIFNYGRREVQSFLISSALFWLDRYHMDGLRVDAVASMLYRDYSRKEGEWLPNQYGGRENIEAIDFLRRFNETVYKEFPDAQTIAEESTAWPMVSRPTYVGGLGFGLKWDMGWMHDTLKYMSKDPIHRKYHHNEITFRMVYAFHENFVLPLSHDEVVHGKGSLLGKMPGDEWRKFANLRLLYSYMYAQAGKKLLFMGAEIAQWDEWHHDRSLDWHLLAHEPHQGVFNLLCDLNRIYRSVPAMHVRDSDPAGFEWIDGGDADGSTLVFMRRGHEERDVVLCILNFTPVPRHNHRVGVPFGGRWKELFNSDAATYGGSGHGNMGGVDAAPIAYHGRPWSLNLMAPPLGAVFLTPESEG